MSEEAESIRLITTILKAIFLILIDRAFIFRRFHGCCRRACLSPIDWWLPEGFRLAFWMVVGYVVQTVTEYRECKQQLSVTLPWWCPNSAKLWFQWSSGCSQSEPVVWCLREVKVFNLYNSYSSSRVVDFTTSDREPHPKRSSKIGWLAFVKLNINHISLYQSWCRTHAAFMIHKLLWNHT